MRRVLHGSATTTDAIRRAIQVSQESLSVLAKRHGINLNTLAKWRKRTSVADLPKGPRDAKSTVLKVDEFICEKWASELERFTLNPINQMPGLDTYQQQYRLYPAFLTPNPPKFPPFPFGHAGILLRHRLPLHSPLQHNYRLGR